MDRPQPEGGVGHDDAIDSGSLHDMDRRTDLKSCWTEYFLLFFASSINTVIIPLFV